MRDLIYCPIEGWFFLHTDTGELFPLTWSGFKRWIARRAA